MRVTLASLSVIAILASSMGAYAATKMVTGTVKTVDAKHASVVLNDGSKYTLPKGFKASKLKAGEKVKISFHAKHAKKFADSLKVVK